MGWAKAVSRAGNLAAICQRCDPCGSHVSSQHPAMDRPGGDHSEGQSMGIGVLLPARLRWDPAQWLSSATMKIEGHQSGLHGLTYELKSPCLSFPINSYYPPTGS